MSSSTSRSLIAGIVIVAALAVGFWMLVLSPKRKEVSDLSKQATATKQSLAQHQEEVSKALEAKREFPVDYQQLVVLGKAVPADDETPSLLIQLNRIAQHAHVHFRDLVLESEGAEAPEEPTAPSATEGLVSPTEVAASTLPLGAAIGPAGLAVMPYTLTFKGDFFHLADFIKGLDSLVKTENSKVAVDGRLMTIDSFVLEADQVVGFPTLEATFLVTTYLTPPEQGLTAGATPSSPEATSTPVSTTTGGTP